MTDTIEGCDLSHWQGIVDCAKGYAKGLRYVGIKVSQGVNVRDDKAAINNTNARAAGFLTYPYHFVTRDAPLTQYNWMMTCIGSMKFDLAPALDYEFYNQVSGEPYYAMREGDFRFPYGATKLGINMWAMSLGLVIPPASTLYYMANKLKNWQSHPVPAIYTNLSTANSYLINSTTYNWSQFLLWFALWNATIITKPNSWKNEAIYIHQDRVIRNAQDWGVNGDMDHDLWGDKLPFPINPPIEDTFEYTGHIVELNRTITGILK